MMEVDPPSKFTTKDDEVRYWMDVARQMYHRKEEVEREMAEYQENSLLYEKELESSFEQTDKRNRDLCHMNEKLKADNEHLRHRLSQQMADQLKIQAQMQELKESNDQMMVRVRKLEQNNDDLERANRESKTSEEEMETQFNAVLEKLALLETDVDEKEGLKITVQRLKDENKDLKQQIQVDLRHRNSNNGLRSSLILQSRPNSTASDLFQFDEGQIQTQWNYESQNDEMIKYAQKLKQKVEILETNIRISKLSEEQLSSKFNLALEKIAHLEAQLVEKENLQAKIHQLKSENQELTQEVDVRLRTHKSKTMERARSYSINNKIQEEKQRSSTGNRLSRNVENRVKKVKEEEKRQQNLMWFLKKLKYTQPNWLRRKEN